MNQQFCANGRHIGSLRTLRWGDLAWVNDQFGKRTKTRIEKEGLETPMTFPVTLIEFAKSQGAIWVVYRDIDGRIGYVNIDVLLREGKRAKLHEAYEEQLFLPDQQWLNATWGALFTYERPLPCEEIAL